MRQGAEVYQKLKALAKKKYGQSAGNVGDEGGVAPDIQTAEEALDLITDAIEQAGYTGKMNIAMDVASSEFYKEDAKKYDLDFKNPDSDPTKWITYEELAKLYGDLSKKYPIVSIEDPFDQDDWSAWSHLTGSTDIQIVGDDLTVTNPLRIATAVEKKACNSLLLKVNQIGTITESIKVTNTADFSHNLGAKKKGKKEKKSCPPIKKRRIPILGANFFFLILVPLILCWAQL